MTRQDYELIARVIRDSLEHNACGQDQREMCETVAHNFASRLATTNPRFDRARFLRACGVGA